MGTRFTYDVVVVGLLLASAAVPTAAESLEFHRVAQALLLKRCADLERLRILPVLTGEDEGGDVLQCLDS